MKSHQAKLNLFLWQVLGIWVPLCNVRLWLTNHSDTAFISACDEGPGLCAHLITFLSILLVFVTIPFSLCFTVKVVQEYERVVIFHLGRLKANKKLGELTGHTYGCISLTSFWYSAHACKSPETEMNF